MKRLLLLFLLFAAATAAAGEKSVTLKRDFGTLYGTLLSPEDGAETAALIIAGSGPTDRNGNNPMGMNANPYRMLAEALEQAGIASLRYDKRAIGTSRYDDPTQLAEVTLEDFVGDAAALADYLAAEGYKKVVLIGHSEGALIALLAAQQSKVVSAVVSLAGAGYPLDEILRLQLAAQLVPAHMEMMTEAEGIAAALKRGERVDMEQHNPAFQALFNAGVQAFLISSFRYDPRQEIRKVPVPVLVVNGDNDLQVSADNAEQLVKARPGTQKAIIPGMTHPLKKSDATALQEQFRTVYSDPALPLAPGLAEAVVGFIRTL